MKKVFVVVLVVALALVFAGVSFAVPKGKTVEFAGGAQGKVTFSGDVHANAGNKCGDCHTKIFQMKKGSAKITAPHKPGEFCGTCHDGKKAFVQEGNCDKCHKK